MPNLDKFNVYYGPHHSKFTRGSETLAESVVEVLRGTVSEWRQSNNTPGYYTLMKTHPGLLPNNYCKYVRAEDWNGTGFQRSDLGEFHFLEEGVFSSYHPENSLDLSSLDKLNLYNGALTKARLKLKDASFNTGIFLAEGRQSWDLIANNVRRLGSFLHFANKADVGRALTSLGIENPSLLQKLMSVPPSKRISNLILEVQYGWRPLVHDLYDLTEAIQKRCKGYVPPVRVSAAKSLEMRDILTESIGGGRSMVSERKVNYTRKVTLCYNLTSASLNTLQQFGVTNPASVIWEVTKYSFLVDWVLKVGDFLSQFDASLGLTYVGGCETAFSIQTVKTQWVNQANAGYDSWSEQIIATRKVVSWIRNGLTLEPYAALPYIKDPFSNEHALNAFALLRSNLRK